MASIWAFLKRKGNREILAWLGGGAVVVIGALWTAIVFFADHKKPDGNGPSVKAGDCAVAAGRDAIGNAVNCDDKPAASVTKP